MSLELARRKFLEVAGTDQGLITDQGKLLAHSLFPDDFEYYMIGLELVDSETNQVTDRFVFPVNPDNISITEQKVKTINKTGSGIVTMENNSFVPKNITISGTFGRRFRLLVGNKETQSSGDIVSDVVNSVDAFVPDVKTGYGAAKNLERIFRKSSQETDTGKPYWTNFYNLAFNQSFIVEFMNLEIKQSKEQNMLWYYAINMVAVAPATITKNELSGLSRIGAIGTINNKVSQTVSDIERNFV